MRLSAALALAALMISFVAFASAPVVIVVGPASNLLVRRVVEELELMGYGTQVMDRSSEWLDASRRLHAVGVVEVDPDRGEVVMWTLGGGESSQLETRRRVNSPDPQVLALRAAELLHGQLEPVPEEEVEGDSGPRPDPDRKEEPATTRPPAQRPPAPVGVFAGPAVTWTRGGVPPLYGLHVEAGVRALHWLEIDALAIVPISRAGISVEKGSSEIHALWTGVGARLVWRPRGFVVDGGANVLAQRAAFETTADSPFSGSSAERWSLRTNATAGAAWLPHPRLAVRASLLLGAGPAFKVLGPDNPSERQDAEPVAELRSPFATVSLGLVIELGPH